jgi:antirestriction protein ArdC
VDATLERGARRRQITRSLRHNAEPYKGINILQLWAAAEIAGYACPIWLTFQQPKELGGLVKKGEHGSPLVYASTFKRKDQAEDGRKADEEIPFLKEYTVFNAEQCEGLPERFYALAEPPKEKTERIEHAERFFANTGAKIDYGENRAFCSITTDSIRMPPFETFRDSESHAATVVHELTHWTRHPSRLNRNLGRNRFGDEGYAFEELVADLGFAFLCAEPADHAGDSRGPRQLRSQLAATPQRRQAGRLHRRVAREQDG